MAKNTLRDISNTTSINRLLHAPIENNMSSLPKQLLRSKRKHNDENESPNVHQISRASTRLQSGVKKPKWDPDIYEQAVSVFSPEHPRKEKSLTLLCERFFEMYPLREFEKKSVIDLGHLTDSLGSERRRLYDIVNILESLNMAEKMEKNRYAWKGSNKLMETLSRLKRLALQWKVDPSTGESMNSVDSQSEEANFSRKDRSLGILCQKFLMLFLVSSPPHKVTLDAALVFLRDPGRPSHDDSRTKNRRVYDISNVLTVLKLVEKTTENHKLFKYIGPKVDAVPEEEVFGSSRMRQSLLSPRNPVTPYTPSSHFSQMALSTPIRGKTPTQDKTPIQGGTPTQDKTPIQGRTPIKENFSLFSPRTPEERRSAFEDMCQFASLEHKRLEQEEASLRRKSVDQIRMPAPRTTPVHRPTPIRLCPTTSTRVALTFRNPDDPPSPRIEPNTFFANNFPTIRMTDPEYHPESMDTSSRTSITIVSVTPERRLAHASSPVVPNGSSDRLVHYKRVGVSTPLPKRSESQNILSPVAMARYLYSPVFHKESQESDN